MNYNKKIKILFCICLALTTIATIFLFVSFKWCFNSETGYFINSAPTVLFSIIYFLGIALPIVATFSIAKKKIIKTPNEIGLIRVPYLIIALALALCAIIFNLALSTSITTTTVLGVCFVAIYAILCSASNGYRNGVFKILFAYLSVILPLSMIMYNNSNYTRHINSVENILTTVFALSFMTYILYEAKRIHEGTHSRWHFGAMLLTVHTGITLSVAYILVYLSKSVNEKPRFLQTVIILLVTLLVALELFRFVKVSNCKTKEDWDEIENPQNPEPNLMDVDFKQSEE